MKISIEGMMDIAQSEGICLQPYLDSVGEWTIGVGHTRFDGIAPNPALMNKKDSITLQQAISLFKKTIIKYSDAVDKAIQVPITQPQFDALVSFQYNTGAINKATLTKLINAKATTNLVMDSLMQWTKGTVNGKLVNIQGLVNRRNAEKKLYTTGEYANDGTAPVFPVNSKNKPIYSKSKKVNITQYFIGD